MTANASPAVLAPVDVHRYSTRVLKHPYGESVVFDRDPDGHWVQAEDHRAAVEQMAAALAAAREERDAESARLNWLLDNCAVVKTDGKRFRVEYEWLPEGTEGPFAATRRTAIDAARQEPRNG